MALDTKLFGDALRDKGYSFITGVPCSLLSGLINYSINECNYVMSANEGDAVAIASGASMAGQKAVVLMQNSGLGNAVSPLTSLNNTFSIPILGFVSLRGEPGTKDEPQHELMGRVTERMLSLLEIEWEYLSNDFDEALKQLHRADQLISNNKSFFFVVKKLTFNQINLKHLPPKESRDKKVFRSGCEDELPVRKAVISCVLDSASKETVLLSTTGKSGRELYELNDSDRNFYMIGSMGCVSSIGLGMALNCEKKIIAIDGDGALLMRMGSMATNAYYAPGNMLHLLIDNNAHESTGSQFTAAKNMDFVKIANGAGYERSVCVQSLEELKKEIRYWEGNSSLTFLYIKAEIGESDALGRPELLPENVRQRLMDFIND